MALLRQLGLANLVRNEISKIDKGKPKSECGSDEGGGVKEGEEKNPNEEPSAKTADSVSHAGAGDEAGMRCREEEKKRNCRWGRGLGHGWPRVSLPPPPSPAAVQTAVTTMTFGTMLLIGGMIFVVADPDLGS